MATLKSRLRHAFSVDQSGPVEPTAQQQEAVDWFCLQVAKRGLATPGLIALEMARPLNFIASQTLHFFSPGVWAIFRQQSYEKYNNFAAFLEKRGSIDFLVHRIEHFENNPDTPPGDERHPQARR